MAGIISNVDSDVQKLRKLKNEIENVKKALKGINIIVDIDIAKGLQSQLTSLIGQYDSLVDKVAAAEGKIMLSVSRINKATESIIQANERIAQSAGIPVQDGNGITQANTTETASVQAQAKAYEDLRIEINDILGTRDANVKRMVEEMNAIRLINAELKKITKQQGESSSLSSDQKKRIEQLNNSLLTHKAALSEVRQTLSNNAKLDNAASTSMKGLSQSLSRMRIAYRELTEEERNSPFGKELLASIQQADAKIKELDATIGNHQRNVGNYASGWNGLSMSIQQIGRELPSLAYGPKVFFSAISNNLPILADEIKRARTEYELLKKSGQSAVPVWKQVVSSLISWQTALTVGITLLTLYGDKIVDWASGLFKAKKALADTYQATEEFQDSVSKSSGKILTTIEKLSRAWMKLGDDVKSKEKFILDYKSELDSTGIAINNVADAENFLSKNKDSFINAIIAKAKATAIMELASKEYEKYIQKMLEADAKAEKGISFGDRAKSWFVRSFAQEDSSGTLQNSDLTPDVFAKERESQLRKDAESHKTSMLNLIKKALGIDEESNKEIERAGGKSKDVLVANSVESIEAAISAKREELKKATNRKDYLKIETEIKAEQTKLEAITGNAKQENKAKKEAEEKLKHQEQLSEQLLSLLRKNQQDEINLMEEGTEKKLAQINADFETQKQAIEKQAKELAKTNKEAGNTEINANGLTAEQQSGIDKANALNIESRKKAESEIYRIEAESMRDYLKEYGTFQQQKLAIAEEYAEKIRKAQKEGERLYLEKQRDSALLKVDVEAARQSIDWQNVFGNLGMILTEQVQPTIDNLRKITQSDEFKNASIDDKRQLFDILSQLESQSGSLGKGFSQVAQDLKLYQNSVNAYNEAYKRQADALEKLVKAQERLKQAQQNGGDMQAELQAVDEAKAIFDQASESVKVLGEKASENANILQASASKTKNALNGLAGNLNKLKSGSLAEAFEGIKGLGKTLGGKLGDAIANIDPTGIIGGILSIMDILKDGVSSIFVSLQDVLFGAIEGILDDVLSGDIITKTIGNTLSHVGNIWNTLTFGGFNKLFGIGGNAKEVQDSINRLTDRNEELQTSIEDLTDEIKASMGTKSVAAYRDAYKYQKEANENYKKIAQEQARYSGSHHSWNYYWNGFSQNQISDFSRKIGREWNGDIWNLTPEEMKMLRETVDMWEQIQNTGKGGYGGRLTDKLDDYIEQAGKLEELTDALYEGLTGISFDSMYDSFVSNLMDMKYDAKAAAEDISEYFMRAMLSNKIGELYSEKLEAWWKKFGASMEDNELTESERKALQDEYMGYVEEAMKLRDELAAATGYDKVAQEATSQSSTRGGYQAMSQDVGEELSGRFTALQIAGEEIKNQNAVQSQSLNLLTMKADALLFISSETRNIADETRDIMARSYLELVQISENTGNSAKYLKDIKDDIAEVKRNTSKL